MKCPYLLTNDTDQLVAAVISNILAGERKMEKFSGRVREKERQEPDSLASYVLTHASHGHMLMNRGHKRNGCRDDDAGKTLPIRHSHCSALDVEASTRARSNGRWKWRGKEVWMVVLATGGKGAEYRQSQRFRY